MKRKIEIKIFVDFCEKEILNNKVRDYCHLKGSYRGPAHSNCNINVTQKQSNFIRFAIHNFSNYHCHVFFKNLMDKKIDEAKFDNIPRTNEEYISISYHTVVHDFLIVINFYQVLQMN